MCDLRSSSCSHAQMHTLTTSETISNTFKHNYKSVCFSILSRIIYLLENCLYFIETYINDTESVNSHTQNNDLIKS